MIKFLFVFLGGGAGSVARYLVGMQTLRAFGPHWPYGTLTVNLTGGLLMGLLVGYLAHRGGADQDRWRVLFGVGVLGGFTTFSAFSLETARMVETRDYAMAFGYVAGSVVLAVSAVFLGLMLARRVFA
jgi:CrcB protein